MQLQKKDYGILTKEQALSYAQKFFSLYDKNKNGIIDDFEIQSMMVNNYKNMNQSINPTINDIKTFQDTLDIDQDGKITQKDFEIWFVKFFTQNKQQIVNLKYVEQQIEPLKGYIPKNSLKASTRLELPQLNMDQTKKFTQYAKQRLEEARQMFEKFDTDGSGYITEEEVGGLLMETYRMMGLSYTPAKSDIQSWMDMTDTDNDGRVTFNEFEALIIKTLLVSGVQLYE